VRGKVPAKPTVDGLERSNESGGRESAASGEQGNPGFFQGSVACGRGYFSFSCRRLDIIVTKRYEMQQTASMIPDTSSTVILKYE
jgi:hypothetical protein